MIQINTEILKSSVTFLAVKCEMDFTLANQITTLNTTFSFHYLPSDLALPLSYIITTFH